MDLLNKRAIHPIFGEGTITSMEGGHISVMFNEKTGEKKFSYPRVFQNHMEMADSEAQEYVSDQLHDMLDTLEAERARKEKEFLEENSRKPAARAAARKTAVKKSAPKKAPAKKTAAKTATAEAVSGLSES